MKKERIALIGPGRLGQAVGRLLFEAEYPIEAVIGRDPDRTRMAARFIGRPEAATTDPSAAAAGEIVLLCLPDDHLAGMAKRLRQEGHLAPRAVLVHFSGLHPASILLDEQGEGRGLAIHPLQTFADAVMGVRSLPGSPCSVEGEEDLLPLGERLAEDLGGRPFRLSSERKPLYHAAACVASNYLVSLVSAAAEIMAGCGFDREKAFHLLVPLLRGTGRNLAALGPEKALTGPIARGDLRTVSLHLEALRDLPADLQELYRVMGKKTAAVALGKRTLSEEKAREILKLLDEKG